MHTTILCATTRVLTMAGFVRACDLVVDQEIPTPTGRATIRSVERAGYMDQYMVRTIDGGAAMVSERTTFDIRTPWGRSRATAPEQIAADEMVESIRLPDGRLRYSIEWVRPVALGGAKAKDDPFWFGAAYVGRDTQPLKARGMPIDNVDDQFQLGLVEDRMLFIHGVCSKGVQRRSSVLVRCSWTHPCVRMGISFIVGSLGGYAEERDEGLVIGFPSGSVSAVLPSTARTYKAGKVGTGQRIISSVFWCGRGEAVTIETDGDRGLVLFDFVAIS